MEKLVLRIILSSTWIFFLSW